MTDDSIRKVGIMPVTFDLTEGSIDEGEIRKEIHHDIDNARTRELSASTRLGQEKESVNFNRTRDGQIYDFFWVKPNHPRRSVSIGIEKSASVSIGPEKERPCV